MAKYLSDSQVADRYGLHRATVWRWAKKGHLPQPIQLTEGTTRWKLEDIERFEEERKAQSV